MIKNKSAGDRRGLLAGGNWITDQVKMIDVYPQPEQLANIRSQSEGTGGAAYNVLIDLARSGTPVPLYAELVRRNKAGRLDFSGVRSVNLDEYTGHVVMFTQWLSHRSENQQG